jgi:hypothetical protein
MARVEVQAESLRVVVVVDRVMPHLVCVTEAVVRRRDRAVAGAQPSSSFGSGVCISRLPVSLHRSLSTWGLHSPKEHNPFPPSAVVARRTAMALPSTAWDALAGKGPSAAPPRLATTSRITSV